MSFDDYNSAIYTGAFIATTIQSSIALQDLFTITGSTACRTILEAIEFGETSTAVLDTQQVEVRLYRGVTAVSSAAGGGAVIPMYNMKGHSAAPQTGAVLQGHSSAAALTSAAQLLHADTTNWGGNWEYIPDDGEEIYLDVGQALTCRVTAPGSAIVVAGAVKTREVPLKG
jgi:hypothetical protein